MILGYFRSCYTTIGAAITTCKITATALIEGTTEASRKKRSANPILEQQPILKVKDTLVPYDQYISASKVMFLFNLQGTAMAVLTHFFVIKGP